MCSTRSTTSIDSDPLPGRPGFAGVPGPRRRPPNVSATTTPAPEATFPESKAVEPGLISGGHLVAKALKAEGIDVIYTLCGGHIIDIYDGCIDEGIKVIDVRHEQVAAHAADAYARVTGKPGCAVVTAGPGTTDAITGVANAFRAESPFLLIGGQGALNQHKMGSLQDLPHVDIMKPITKFASNVVTTERVADMCSMAFREAMAGAPGPVFLEIGRDILDNKVPVENAVIPGEPSSYRASTKSIGDPNDVDKLTEILINAERPCVLLGTQVWTSRGHQDAIEFVRELNIPAYMNGAARGTLPPGDPHHFHLTRRYAFNNADVIVIVGTPFDFRMGYGKRLSREATVVQIDMSYQTVGKNRDVSLGLVGDPGAILREAATAAARGAILREVARAAQGRSKGEKREGWLETLRAEEQRLKEERLPRLMKDTAPIHPLRLAHEINEALTDNTRFIGDGGDIVTFSVGVVQLKGPGLWMHAGPLGTIGVGMPFCIGAKQADPDREVMCLFGDGAFSLTGFDFDTAVRFALPFIGIFGN